MEPETSVSILADDADNRVLECALTARVDLVVTGDRAMVELGNLDGIRIVTLREYLSGPLA